ncbi:MAG TPA: DUF501 domain-containing protein [Coriobacteriia bacterium]|nr:DUF501 domain-containing protein [Coriobacteriia bacterium]
MPVTTDDVALVEWQLGRMPRGRWRVVSRCAYGWPMVVETAPRLEDGTAFPTLYYLTCPHLVATVSRMESEGHTAEWRARLGTDPDLAARLRDADAAYRRLRAVRAGRDDPCGDVGIAGQRDPLGVKCLHAHVAGALAGIDDPIGVGILATIVRECDDDRCGRERP